MKPAGELLDLAPAWAEKITVGNSGLAYQGVISPARARTLMLTFPGTGGSARVRLSMGLDLMPFIGADVVYGLYEHERMPWPLNAGDFDPGVERLLSLIDHLEEQSRYTGSQSRSLSRALSAAYWLTEEILRWVEDENYDLLGTAAGAEVELIYNVSATVVNSLVYWLAGWNGSSYDIIGAPDELFLQVDPAVATVLPGGRTQFKLLAHDPDGNSLSLGRVTWSVSGGGTIDSRGVFVASRSAQGTYTVTATLKDHIRTTPFTATAEVTVSPDATLGSLSGILLDNSDPPRPVAGVPLIIYSQGAPSYTEVRTESDSRGLFFAPGLPSGSYGVRLDDHDLTALPSGALEYRPVGWVINRYWNYESTADYQPPQYSWWVNAPRETGGVEFHLIPAPGSLSIRVVTASRGEPVSGVWVMAYGHRVLGDHLCGNRVLWRKTDSDGYVNLADLPCGSYTVSCPVKDFELDDSVWKPQEISLNITGATPREIVIKLRPSGG